jgi:pyridoxal phosphate enzyme (YggS family)
VVELITDLRADTIRTNLAQVREEIATAAGAAGRDGGEVEVLAATKYVSAGDLPILARAGIELVGENRAQDLAAKVGECRRLFEWDFIGRLQSRKVKAIVPHVRLIHSVASESALRELARHRTEARAGLEILVEVNVAREPGKEGVAPEDLEAFIELAPVPVVGLMTMPPFAEDPEESRRWFAALRALADERGLERLSMGTSQDYLVAVQEGATIVRIGTRLYDPRPRDG